MTQMTPGQIAHQVFYHDLTNGLSVAERWESAAQAVLASVAEPWKLLKPKYQHCQNEWFPENCHSLKKPDGTHNPCAKLPPLEQFVEILWFDGEISGAAREISFEPGCGWMWATASSWIVPGHPLVIAWRPIEEEKTAG